MAISTAAEVTKRPRIARAAALMALLAAGCGPTAWTKPGLTQSQLSQDSARCRASAEAQNQSTLSVQGTPSQVGGAILLDAIYNAVSQRGSYHDCMVAAGYTPATRTPPTPMIRDPATGRWVSRGGRFELMLSSEWVPNTAATVPANHLISARNIDDTTFVLIDRTAQEAADILVVAGAIAQEMAVRLPDAAATPPERVTVGPYSAARFELTVQRRNERGHCLITLVRTASQGAILVGCAAEAKFAAQRDKIVAATASLRELAR